MRLKHIIFLALLITFPLFLYSAETAPAQIDPDKFYLLNGFDDETNWTTSDWANNALSTITLSNDFITQGKKSMEVSLNAVKAGQGAIVQVLDPGDMSDINEISVDIYNSSMLKMDVRLMVKTGEAWQYHESKPIDIKPGWNKNVVFDLAAAEYTAEGANTFNKKISNRNFVRRLGFLFYPGKPVDGAIYFDNLRIKGGQSIAALLPQEAPANLKTVLIDDFEKGTLKWSAAAGWSCAAGVDKIKMPDGNQVLKARFNMSSPGMNAAFITEGSFDLSGVNDFIMDVFNPNDTIMNCGFALATGDKWAWQEAPIFKLKKGWNRDVKVSFIKKYWKNESSGWKSNVTPGDIKSVKRINMLLYPPDMGEGYALIDNIRMTTTEPEKLETLKPVDIGPVAFSVWNSFEKGVNWSPAADAGGAIAVNPAFEFGGQRINGMELVYSTRNEVDKAVYSYRSSINFANSVGMKFDIYNPNAYGVKISVAFKTGDQESWNETKQIGIAPGWNRGILIDFVSPSFKSADSNWNYTDPFYTRNDIREIDFQIYPDAKVQGKLYVSEIKLARRNFLGDIGEWLGFTFVNNSKVKVESINYSLWDNGSSEGGFESDAALNYWTDAGMSDWGVSRVSISDKFPSQGKKSLRMEYKDANIKVGLAYKSVTAFSVSDKDYFTFDVYNPGKLMKCSMVFDDGNTGGWYETKQYVIYPGWNRNIKVDLNSNDWKHDSTNLQNCDILRIKNAVKNIFIIFYGGIEGSIYLDNVRWGKKSGLSLTQADVTQDINLELSPLDNIDAKLTLRAAYHAGGANELALASGHINLRGFGNELSVFSGEPAKIIDDVFGIVDPGAVGPNNMGVSLAGTVFPINTSYILSGLSLDASEPWKLSTSYLMTARIKTYLFEKNFIGALYVNNRRGYSEGADIFSGNFEQSSHVYGGDASLAIPGFGLFDLNLKGEVLFASYDTLKPVYLIDSVPPKYVFEDLTTSADRKLIYGQADLHAGYLTLYANLRMIDRMFSATYCNQDYKPGDNAMSVKATYIMDDVPPFSILKSLSPESEAFVRGTQLMVEYNRNHQLGGLTYQKDSLTIDLKNDEALAMSNYHIWYSYATEGNPYQIPTSSFTATTKLLIANLVTTRVLLRYQALRGTFYNGTGDPALSASFSEENYPQYTGFLEAGIKLFKDYKLTASCKLQNARGIWYTNAYAEAEANLVGAVNAILSYGEKPFTGYWSDDNSRDTKDVYMLSLKAYF